MSVIQRTTIAFLALVALAVWGVGVRAALRSDASEDRDLPVSAMATDTAEDVTPTVVARLTATPPSPTASKTRTPTSTKVATSTPSPTATRTATPTSSPSATLTRTPSPTPSPTATATRHPTSTATATLTPVGTPVIPEVGRFLLVNQDEQLLRVYEDGVEIRSILVSTGRPVANAFTPAWRGDVGRYWGSGPFLNTDFWSDHMWYLFPGARGSILIHSVPYTRDGDLKLYDQPDALGLEPSSHGCVRISPEDALWLKSWNPVGVPIEITPWTGEIGPPDESL